MRFKVYVSPKGHVFIVATESNVDGQRFSFFSQRVRGSQGRQHHSEYRNNDAVLEMAELGFEVAGEFSLLDLRDIKDRKTLHAKCEALIALLDIFVAEKPDLPQPTEEINRTLLAGARIIQGFNLDLLDVTLFEAPQPPSAYQWESFR